MGEIMMNREWRIKRISFMTMDTGYCFLIFLYVASAVCFLLRYDIFLIFLVWGLKVVLFSGVYNY